MAGEVEKRGPIRLQSQPHPPDLLIARLAAAQHGVASRRQLLALPLTLHQIRARIGAGRLIPIHRGVYAVGHGRLTREGRWMAAVLAGGPWAVLSHESAAMHWLLLSPHPSEAHVTAPVRGRRRDGIRFHGARLRSDERTTRDGIPVTTVARTLLDLAAGGDGRRLERALAQAEFHRYTDRPALPELVRRHRGERGAAVARRLLAGGAAELGVTRSALEERFVAFCVERRIPRPELNAAIHLGERHVLADCLWRRQRLVVELDGFASHGDSRRAFESDAARQRAMMAAGWRVLRVTWRQLRDEPLALATDLRAMLGLSAA